MIARSLLTLAALFLSPIAGAEVVDLSRGDRRPGSVASGQFTPGRPPPAHFGGPAPFACPTRGAQAFFADELVDLAKTSNKPVPVADGRLCAAAEAFLGWEAKEPVRAGLGAFAISYFGVVTHYPQVQVLMVNAKDDEPKELAVQVFEQVGNFFVNAKRPHYGMMVQRVRKGSFRAVVALADEPPVALDPVPMRLELGESAKVSGKLLDDYDRPRVLVSDATGKLTVAETASGASFEARAACGTRPGVIRVEILGELGGSPTRVARFAIACGTPVESSAPVNAPEGWTGDAAAQARKMLEAVNAERTGAGLPALVWDAALADVAGGVAEAIKAEVARGAFDIPKDLAARLKKVGIASPVVLQNPAQGRSVQEVMGQMASSPGHRASYMDPEVTNAGIGAVTSADAEGRPVVFVDQIFIKELPPLDPVATAEKLRAAVVQKRKDGRFPAAASDPDLEAFAQTYAKELAAASGNLPKARQAELTKALDKRFKAVAMTSGARQEPLDFAEEAEVTATGKHFGVGVALGMHEKLGRNAVYAVIAVGQERGGKDAEPEAGKKGKKKK